MKVLVTGASGFLGSHVAEELVREGHEVRALVRKSSDVRFLSTLDGVELVYGAIEEADKVHAAAEGVDAIVHSAAIVKARSEAEFHATNVGGTLNVLAAARRPAGRLKRLVYVSSLEACGPSADGQPVAVEQEKPVTRYGRSKLAAEKALLAAKGEVPVTILRPTAIYGPRDREIFEAFLSVKRGVLPITGDGRTHYTFVYATDCARACVRAIERDLPSGAIFHLSDGGVYTQRGMMEDIERAFGKRAMVRVGLPLGVLKAVSVFVEAYGKLRDVPVMLTREKAQMLSYRYWVCSSDEAKDALAWEPAVRLPEGVKLTVKWYQDNGWL